ncbi:MAG: hypothetical protein AAF658_07895, partial [Myxococcota bacterium]
MRLRVLSILLVSVFAACSSDEDSPPNADADANEGFVSASELGFAAGVELNRDTRVSTDLAADGFVSFDRQSGVVSFQDDSAFAQRLSVGRILLSADPSELFIGRISEITTGDGSITLTLGPAAIADAFTALELDAPIPLDATTLRSNTLGNGASLAVDSTRQVLSGTIRVDIDVEQTEGNLTTSTSGQVELSMSGSIGVFDGQSVGNANVVLFRPAIEFAKQLSTNTSVTGPLPDVPVMDRTDIVRLGALEFAPVELSPNVWFEPVIELYAGYAYETPAGQASIGQGSYTTVFDETYTLGRSQSVDFEFGLDSNRDPDDPFVAIALDGNPLDVATTIGLRWSARAYGATDELYRLQRIDRLTAPAPEFLDARARATTNYTARVFGVFGPTNDRYDSELFYLRFDEFSQAFPIEEDATEEFAFADKVQFPTVRSWTLEDALLEITNATAGILDGSPYLPGDRATIGVQATNFLGTPELFWGFGDDRSNRVELVEPTDRPRPDSLASWTGILDLSGGTGDFGVIVRGQDLPDNNTVESIEFIGTVTTDAPPVARFASTEALVFGEGDGLSIEVLLDGPARLGDSVTLAVENPSGALNDEDFTNLEVLFAEGEMTGTTKLTARSDGVLEGLESGTVAIAATSSSGITSVAPRTLQVSIEDPSVRFTSDSPVTLSEGGAGVEVSVTMTAPAAGTETVPLIVSNGLTLDDLGGSPLQFTFEAGERTAGLTLLAPDDGFVEGTEEGILRFGLDPTGVTYGALTELSVRVEDAASPPPPTWPGRVLDLAVGSAGSSPERTVFANGEI